MNEKDISDFLEIKEVFSLTPEEIEEENKKMFEWQEEMYWKDKERAYANAKSWAENKDTVFC